MKAVLRTVTSAEERHDGDLVPFVSLVNSGILSEGETLAVLNRANGWDFSRTVCSVATDWAEPSG